MKYALFIAVPPKFNRNNATIALSKLEEAVNNEKELMKDCKQLLSGVWECDLNAGLYPLSMLVCHAKLCRLESRTLFLETSPSWVVTPIDKKP